VAVREWTDSQKLAIKTRDRTLLVSAAAGSGKTATLTERIIRSLLDADNPTSVDSLLVVTFTNAAARELRLKLSRALEQAVAENPDNKELERQLFMLPTARIRTIDSFCAEVLRSNCDRVGVPPNYRIADGAECQLLANSVVEGLINSAFRGELPEVSGAEEFDELSDCLTNSGSSESLSEVFCMIRERCDSSEKGVDSLLPMIERLNPKDFSGFEKSFFGEYIIDRLTELCLHYKKEYERVRIRVSAGDSKAEKGYLDLINSDLDLIEKILAAKTYAELHSLLPSVEYFKKPSVRAANHTDATLFASGLRDHFKKELSGMVKYFLYPPEGMQQLFASLHRLNHVLYRFVKKFDEVFLEEKRRRGALSYADIERYTYKCLIKDGKPTDIALNMRRQFSAIYIDEYQDVNSLQNSIFAAIARDDNRFMVGDIKQSIYGFRQAEPQIFADMKDSFPPLREGGEYTPAASLFMSNNFRCDRAIVDFVNGIFDLAFLHTAKSIGYVPEDRLVFTKPCEGEEPKRHEPEICIIPKPDDAPDESDDDEDVDEYIPDNAPRVVAAKIKKLLDDGERLNDGRLIAPSDIAILLRYSRGRAFRYAEALNELGIPAEISGAGDFFLSSEVLLVLCLLNSIDNPRRDIYFAGLLCSPLFGFTADDLFLIRENGTGGTLYEDLTSYVEKHPEFEKGRELLSRLNYYRSISEGIPVDTLIYKLYRETGLLTLAASSGGRENLMILYDYARSYEAGAFKGLYNFINFINSLIDKDTSFDENRDGAESNAVKIVTCHSSKGLEYPVVFLGEAGAKYSNRDNRNRLAFSADFGMAMRLRTPLGLALVNNPVRDIINYQAARKLGEEELRVLYVALTRARERLYVVGTSPVKDIDEFLERLEIKADTLDSYNMFTLHSPLEVIGATVRIPPSATDLCAFLGDHAGYASEDNAGEAENADSQEAQVGEKEAAISATEAAVANENALDEGLITELAARFCFEYSGRHLTELPEKLSVSRTSPTVLDGSEEVPLFAASAGGERRRRLPKFIGGREADESAKRGIATHYLLQFCNLASLREKGGAAELERLVSEGYISKKDGERVRVDEIELFRQSSLFSDMLSAKQLWRELRFNARLPANIFTSDPEKKRIYEGETVLLQGVMDCVIEYPDGTLGIFDYKTDRLTKAERECRPLAESKLREAHKQQLNLYALAAEQIFGKLPTRVEVYSLLLGDTVDVKDESFWTKGK